MPYKDLYHDAYAAYADPPDTGVIPLPTISPVDPGLLLAGDRFWRALRSSHAIVIHVEVLTGSGQPPVDVSQFLDASKSSLDVSRQAIRRSGTLSFAGTEIVPTTADALLAPYGNELRCWYGIPFPDGTAEYVPVGTLRITKTAVKPSRVTLEVSDRAWIVQGARLEQSYSIAKGTPYSEAISALLAYVYPDVEMDIPDVPSSTPALLYDAEADPWDALQQMATACGYMLYFDPLGVCVMRAEPDLIDVDPVWTYNGSGEVHDDYDPDDWANLALYDTEHTWDTSEVYNAVVAVGENTSNDKPYRGVAYDLDPASPTFYGGKFGRRPLFWSSPLFTSSGMAAVGARTRLQSQTGLAESLTIPASPHPGLEPADPIRVVRPELGVDTIHQVDHYPLPLGPGSQQLETRVRRVVLGS
jgi:hypothetical protein